MNASQQSIGGGLDSVADYERLRIGYRVGGGRSTVTGYVEQHIHYCGRLCLERAGIEVVNAAGAVGQDQPIYGDRAAILIESACAGSGRHRNHARAVRPRADGGVQRGMSGTADHDRSGPAGVGHVQDSTVHVDHAAGVGEIADDEFRQQRHRSSLHVDGALRIGVRPNDHRTAVPGAVGHGEEPGAPGADVGWRIVGQARDQI